MPKEAVTTKAFAVAFAVLSASAIAGLVTMTILYKMEYREKDLNPTDRPTFSPATEAPPPVMRLPGNLVPHRYRIFTQLLLYTKIEAAVGNFTSPNQTLLFVGNSTVYFECIQETKSIHLHSVDLTLTHPVVVDAASNKSIKIYSMKQHEDASNFLEIQLEDQLKAKGQYSLFLAFQGEISENLESLFVSTYLHGVPAHEEDTEVNRYLAATNMEPTDARKLFPCFDEPEMKAVFELTIIHRRETTALGNTRSDSNIIDDDWKYTHFDPTPNMSTYLLAFTVSEFTSTTSNHERVKIKTYARPEAVAAGHTQYASNITGPMLTYYEKFFGINYQMQKLDQIALPDLNPVAMENWGLITYQETSLLYEEGVSSLLHKEEIATIVAHELAHQWFGNLVTMKWWNDIWLNEGFATYMSYIAVDHAEPSFKMKDSFLLDDLHTAFEEDALASSHPLSPPPGDIQATYQIMEMFDAITYCKGAVVLRMLVDILGERVFNNGIQRYLSDFKFGNTEQKDLWDYMQKADDDASGNTNVAQVMGTWTNQIGYPVLTINTSDGEVYQNHFLFNDSSESSLWWHIHIRVMSEVSDSTVVWLRTNAPERKSEFISKKGEWILANVNCTGYYRVNYNQENWERLLTQLETNPHRIPLMNRGQLIDDAFNLARAKRINVALALNSTRFLCDERAYIPWESAVRNLDYFVLMFDRSEVYGPMQAYLREQVTGLYNFFRNDTDNSTVPKDHSLQHNQITAIGVACSNGLPECLEMATQKFNDWMTSENTTTNRIHPNLRSVIYCQAVAAGGKKEWEFAWEKYQSSSNTSEKDQLREALACTKKIWLLNR